MEHSFTPTERKLMEEAHLPYDLRLSRYGCNLSPTENGWQAGVSVYDYALGRETDYFEITVPVSGTPQVQNRYKNHNDFPVWGTVWIGEEDRANFGKTAGGFALNPGEWVTIHNISPDLIHSISLGAMVEKGTEMTLIVRDHDTCHDG